MSTTGRNYVDTEMLRYRAGYKETNAFLAVPSFPGLLPGLILAHDIFGLDDHIADVAVRFAQQGYTVLVPDFYSAKGGMGVDGGNGPGATSTYEQRRALRLKTPDQFALKDVTSGFEFLKKSGYADPARVGIVGFGFGGTVATLAAGQSRYFAAAVNFYGDITYPSSIINRAKPNSPLEFVPFINCPYLAFYGAPEEDISRQEVVMLENTLRQKNKVFELKTYPNVPNGFFNDARAEVYNATAASDAIQRTYAFLNKYLRS